MNTKLVRISGATLCKIVKNTLPTIPTSIGFFPKYPAILNKACFQLPFDTSIIASTRESSFRTKSFDIGPVLNITRTVSTMTSKSTGIIRGGIGINVSTGVTTGSTTGIRKSIGAS